MEKIHNIPVDYVTKKGNKFSWVKRPSAFVNHVYHWLPDGKAEIIGHTDTYESFVEIADSYEKEVLNDK